MVQLAGEAITVYDNLEESYARPKASENYTIGQSFNNDRLRKGAPMIFDCSRVSKSDDQNARLQLKTFKNANVEKRSEERCLEVGGADANYTRCSTKLWQDVVTLMISRDEVFRMTEAYFLRQTG